MEYMVTAKNTIADMKIMKALKRSATNVIPNGAGHEPIWVFIISALFLNILDIINDNIDNMIKTYQYS